MTFGESHGQALGVTVDGLPAGLPLSLELIQKDMDRRRPGTSPFVSPRKEPDRVEILSGVASDLTTNGAPICLLIRNTQARSQDYDGLRDKFRPGHADWTYFQKYGIPPQSGGGRASGRETAARVAAGALARAFLATRGVTARAALRAVGTVWAVQTDFESAENDPLRFLDPLLSPSAQAEVTRAKEAGDSVGGVVELSAPGLPPGWGAPVFGKIEALLGGAFFSIGAVRAVEFGEGLSLASKLGSEANDPLGPQGPLTNAHGGVLGGLSTGLPLVARLFVRPTPSVSLPQETVNSRGEKVSLRIEGRHDPCLAPRAAPVAEAMALLVLADLALEPPGKMG